MIVNLSYMKQAKVADLRNNFATLSKWIHSGESVLITKRGAPFATLTPMRGKKKAPPWPDRANWRKRIFPAGPVSGDARDVIDYDRGKT